MFTTSFKPVESYESAVSALRRSVFSLPRFPLTQTKLTERGWVGLANRTWDNIKNSVCHSVSHFKNCLIIFSKILGFLHGV